ncbi:MotB family protein [Rhizobium oryziradicis]|uniref:Flagellar motor protein MotB n=1 Tax=Rhizobium oryziradicis TaxID=1867956 RepID=A0A1Q8ZUS5_9HYPH|nr:MotB family protein [Rhizobium oryziradicis]OLP45811.1 flagellar motor protein MotB [Rhizobium oryziradicis]
MSDAENHHHGKNEVIIIKRHGGGDHDGAHGGAWKIAYADFMTAMMAFFLVMWLVNASNEATKASVASYFNPIKLSDEKPSQQGKKKPVDQAEGEEQKERSKIKADDAVAGKAAATGEDMTSTSGDKPVYSEADLFENPYSVLAEIAQEVGQQANVSAKGEGGASDSGPSTGASGGEAYRDPFDPDFWSQQRQTVEGKPGKQTPSEVTMTQDAADKAPSERSAPEVSAQNANDKQAVKGNEQQAVLVTPTPRPDNKAQQAQDAQDAKSSPDKATKAEEQKQADELKEQIVQQMTGVAGKLAEGLIVTPAEGGLLVTLSDQNDDQMFNIGSALPSKEMVLAMEKIGKLLSERKGAVLIRGHTDGRPYKGADNDNWGLSMARAHAAYYMLVRGGLNEQRITQVSGFADRRLLKPDDPYAAANRRIEILVQGDQK